MNKVKILNDATYNILEFIYERGMTYSKEIENETGHVLSSIIPKIDYFIEKGLIKRVETKQKRNKYFALTPLGVEIFSKLKEVRKKCQDLDAQNVLTID